MFDNQITSEHILTAFLAMEDKNPQTGEELEKELKELEKTLKEKNFDSSHIDIIKIKEMCAMGFNKNAPMCMALLEGYRLTEELSDIQMANFLNRDNFIETVSKYGQGKIIDVLRNYYNHLLGSTSDKALLMKTIQETEELLRKHNLPPRQPGFPEAISSVGNTDDLPVKLYLYTDDQVAVINNMALRAPKTKRELEAIINTFQDEYVRQGREPLEQDFINKIWLICYKNDEFDVNNLNLFLRKSLEENRYKPNTELNEEIYPLDVAMISKNKQGVEILLAHGADKQRIALYLAKDESLKSGGPEFIDFLVTITEEEAKKRVYNNPLTFGADRTSNNNNNTPPAPNT